MHYKDGTAARIGDVVKGRTWDDKPITGTVTAITPGSDRCNFSLVHIVMTPAAMTSSYTLGDFTLIHREEDTASA
jgi:hypothetical protein